MFPSSSRSAAMGSPLQGVVNRLTYEGRTIRMGVEDLMSEVQL
jgi:hypothetical protein